VILYNTEVHRDSVWILQRLVVRFFKWTKIRSRTWLKRYWWG